MKKIKSGTTLAVIKNKHGRLMMAADRRISWGHSYQKSPTPKVVKRDGVLIAGTGDWPLIQTILNNIKLSKSIKALEPNTFIYKYFVIELKKLLLSEGYHNEHLQLAFPYDIADEETKTEVELLVGFKKKLFSVTFGSNSHSISVTEMSTPHASGCGGDLALGSLLTTYHTDMAPKDRLKLALDVAAQVSTGCDANCDIEIE